MTEYYQSDDRVQEKKQKLNVLKKEVSSITSLLDEKKEYKKGENTVFLAFCVNKLNISK